MAKVQWDVTVSSELNEAALSYLAKEGEGVEGLSHLVERAVGAFLKDPSALDRASGLTEGQLDDLIAAERDRIKEKYSGITMGQFNDMVNEGIEKLKKQNSDKGKK